MKENWYSLCVSILTEKTVDDALNEMGIRPPKNPPNKLDLTEKQALNIKFLKDSMTWREMGEIFGINGDALRMQVDSVLKKATKNPDQSVQSSMRKNTTQLYHRLEVMQIG